MEREGASLGSGLNFQSQSFRFPASVAALQAATKLLSIKEQSENILPSENLVKNRCVCSSVKVKLPTGVHLNCPNLSGVRWMDGWMDLPLP